ncbi:ABC transporter substrate-binding protein [Amycolatopsis sp. FU40]|uniref:ABC transporter substrate-binding protein n=1 Tax=Amycolatopsis sp. FU40 TaxID=2914159 RepID=UPI001F41BB6A|nr:ABC transporter substrate-binding protein [Amycolatopsis sp. FU40]UKD57696.1 ABC transporter substrate-binding protein [Amycolatopsis sp. FU40]
MHENLFPALSRRRVLGAAVAGAAGLALAACSGGPPGQSPVEAGDAAPAGPRKRGGTFRFAPSDFAGTVSMDPQASDSSFALATALTDTLMGRDHSWRLQPGLAEEFEPAPGNFRSWTIRVRAGVAFHNGKPLGADDVIHTIRRNLDPKNPGFSAGLLASIDPNGLTALDKRTVRLELKSPNSQLRDGFAEAPTGIVPVGFDPRNPVGTGPFKYQSFQPEQRFVGVRNENYWRHDGPYLDSLELIGFSDPITARTNALISGQIDGMDRVPANLSAQVRARGELALIVSETGAFEFTGMRCDPGAQFSDNRVRQAFKLMLDREQMVKTLYAGFGEPGNDIGAWARIDPAVDGSIPQRRQDLDRAKWLLKSAGMEGMRVTYRVGQVEPSAMSTATLMVEYAKAIGVEATIEPVQNLSSFYGPEYFSSQLKNSYDYTQSLYDNASYCWLPTGGFNGEHFDHPKVNSLFAQAMNTTGGKYEELMHELSRVIHEEGPWLVWGRHNIPDAYRKKFTGARKDASGLGFNGFRWDEISLA